VSSSSQRKDPLPAFNFVVKLGQSAAGSFTECSGLDVSMKTQDFQEGGLNDRVHKLPGPSTQANLTLKRGVVDGQLWNWYLNLLSGNVDRRQVTLEVRGEDQSSAMVVNFYSAYPVKWSGPSLSGKDSQLAVETLELAHFGFDISGARMGA